MTITRRAFLRGALRAGPMAIAGTLALVWPKRHDGFTSIAELADIQPPCRGIDMGRGNSHATWQLQRQRPDGTWEWLADIEPIDPAYIPNDGEAVEMRVDGRVTFRREPFVMRVQWKPEEA
jgi:hypothetical protein